MSRNQETARAVSLQLIWRRDTALPCPLYHFGAAGIDTTRFFPGNEKKTRFRPLLLPLLLPLPVHLGHLA